MPITSDKLGALKRKARREGWLKWIRTPADEHALLKGCWFDIARAEHVEEFHVRFLRHSKGSDFAGKPFHFLEWERDELYYPLFGWVRLNETGKIVRRYQKAYVEIPKKNGKSAIASGIGLYMTVGDGEPGAETYSAASDRNQASIVHREAINMVEQSPELSAILKINRSTWNIAYPRTRSFYRALAATPKTNEGFNAHCILADELHTWTGQAGRDLYDAIRWAFAARNQPLFFQITTAGEDHLSVCGEQHDFAKEIIAGKTFAPEYFALIHAADPKDDPWDKKTWHKANPSLGHTIKLSKFEEDATEAKKTPSGTARFKRYRLNIWTTGDNAWIDVADWDRNTRPFEDSLLEGMDCYAGLDLSRTCDTTSLQLLFPPKEPGKPYYLISRFWLPEEKARELAGKVPYLQWADQGLITLTPGNVVDYAFIEKEIDQLSEKFSITKLAYDKTYAEDVTQRIEANSGIPRIQFGQTIMNFAGPSAEFERLIISGNPANQTETPTADSSVLLHNGHAVMRWQVGNVRVKVDVNNNKRPVKPNNPMDHRKVDGVVAAIMALALAIDPSNGPQRSYYDDHDLEMS